MVDFRIDVIVDPTRVRSGSRVAKRELGGIESASQSLGRSLRNAFAIFGLGTAVRGIVELTDEFTNLQNRLRLVTDSEAQLAGVTDELLRISQRNRVELAATAELYQRTAINADQLGRSQAELLMFTEQVGQAVILSGASATEAAGGIRQLTQGINSNRLSGQELISVLENLPVVADVIADSLERNRGDLRRLGAEGVISADVIINAFDEAGERLGNDFGETIPTLSQEIVRFRNELTILVAEGGAVNKFFSEAVSVATDLLMLLNQIDAQDIDFDANDSLEGVSFQLGTAIENYDVLVDRLRQSLDLPLTDELVDVNELLGRLGEVNPAQAMVLGEALRNAGADIDFLLEKQEEFNEAATRGAEESSQAALIRLAQVGQVRAALEDEADLIARGNDERRIELEIRERLKDLDVERGSGDPLEQEIEGLVRQNALLRELAEEQERIENVEARRAQQRQQQNDDVAEQIELLQRELDLRRAGVQDAERRAVIEQAIAVAIREGNEELAMLLRQLQMLQDELRDASAAGNDFNATQELINAGQSALVGFFRESERALNEFANTGKFNFRDFADSILQDIQRILIRQALLQIFGGAGEFVGGAATTAFGGRRQFGGSVNPRQAFIVGDSNDQRNAELFVPPSAGNIIPAGRFAAASQQPAAPQVNVPRQDPPVVNINNIMDPDEAAEAIESSAGEEAIMNVLSRRRRSVSSLLKD